MVIELCSVYNESLVIVCEQNDDDIILSGHNVYITILPNILHGNLSWNESK